MIFSNYYELEDGGNPFIDPTVGVRDLLMSLRALPSFSKTNSNFTLTKFKELCTLVVLNVLGNERSNGEFGVVSVCLTKLTPVLQILSYILYIKHDDVFFYDSLHWNWLRSSLCDDAFVIVSCINHGLEGEMHWPNANKCLHLGMMNQQFPRYIGFIDGTLVEIR